MGERTRALEAVGLTVPVDPGFWRGRRVLVTGHTGFKGGWLSLWLQSMGARVHGLALPPPTTPALFDAARVGEGMDHAIGDVRDADAVRTTLARVAPEVVLHLAAQPLVRRSYAEPVATYATNVMGTVHVLEAARAPGTVRAVVVVTTDKCYENRERAEAYREEDALGGHDPYSSSKACAELVADAYRRSFLAAEGIAIATARAGNVVGGGDWAEDRLVPDALRAFGRGEPVVLRRPAATRPWQHVLEPLAGYLALAQALVSDGPAYSGAWNFGPDPQDARSVGWVVERVAAHWGDAPGWRLAPGDHPHEAGLLALDSTRARTRLGWNPRWHVERALAETVAWHRAWLAGGDARAACLDQIRRYVAHAG